MSFNAATVNLTDVESTVFSSGTGTTAVLIRNTGSNTGFLGPAGSDLMPIKTDELIAFAGLDNTDVLKGKCNAGLTTTLVVLWR